MSSEFIEFLLWFPAIVVALTLHEFAHAAVADALGDPTPRALGRVTLNPLSHLDMIGTILLVLVHFGWGRPVPVDARYLRQPRRDLVLIAAAGPVINLATALVVGLILRWLAPWLLETPGGTFVFLALQALVLLSLLLAFFNLIPLPPLDGSKVLGGLLPEPLARRYFNATWLSWGLLALILLGSLTGTYLIAGLIYPPSAWLYGLLVGLPLGS
ncbi:MAG: site-2 protease family protein [Gemmatimonadetes bacterium]|nr:site-2 protease family protein [Gemmatimonadota bacterium]MBT6145563.1 site-2 protease family protein [Gemmatimonadota bacterium]MBT7859132.1 site-2 protease family protein [Gemmatimonadota bacterium]